MTDVPAADDPLRAWAELVNLTLRRMDEEYLELRETLAEIDGAKAPHSRVNELHTRIDDLTETVAKLGYQSQVRELRERELREERGE